MDDRNESLKDNAGTVGGQQIFINLVDGDLIAEGPGIEPQQSVITCKYDTSKTAGYIALVVSYLTVLSLSANDLIAILIIDDSALKIIGTTSLLFFRLFGAFAFACCERKEVAHVIYDGYMTAIMYIIMYVNISVATFWYTYCIYIVMDQLHDIFTAIISQWMIVVINNILFGVIYSKLIRPVWISA